MLFSPVFHYVLERYIISYFIAFTVVVYCYYGYLHIFLREHPSENHAVGARICEIYSYF